MTPFLYFRVKALITGTGSLYNKSRGLVSTPLQNLTHFTQYPLAAEYLLKERPLVMLSATDQELSRKQVLLEGSTAAREAPADRCN